MSSHAPLLIMQNVEAFYGNAQALFGVSLDVPPRGVTALVGRNGMGKTTTVRSLMGLARMRGRIAFDGRDIAGWPPFRIAQAGIGLVPEGRQVFPTLTVAENLVATAREPDRTRPAAWSLSRVYTLFPRLRERASQRASTLSGGEQQMLAIGRALMTHPRLLVLDEATEGLAPLLRREIWACLAAIKSEGLSVLIVDKNLHELAGFADRMVVLEKGSVVWSGTPQALREDGAAKRRYLGV